MKSYGFLYLVTIAAILLLLFMSISILEKIALETEEEVIHCFAETDIDDESLEETIFTEEEIYLLAKMVAAEARGEPFEGQVAVAEVIINRVNDPRFPNTIEEVLFQTGQFCPIDNGSFEKVEPSSIQFEAVEVALSGSNLVEDALFFFNPSLANQNNIKWIRARTKLVKIINNHEFRMIF